VEQSNNENPGQEGEGEAHKPAVNDSAGAPGASETPASNEAPPAVAASDALKDLPVVEAPSLDGADADRPAAEPAAEPVQAQADAPIWMTESHAADDRADETAGFEFASAPQPRSFRFALLAATIAVAAGFGSFVGALTASGVGRHEAADAVASRAADARVLQTLKTELAELTALKASVDATNRNSGAQFGKIADRLTSLERAQAEPAAKLARLAEAVDRLDKRSAAAPEITGSIAKPAQPEPAAASMPAASETVLNDWIVRDVRNGRALVESRYGGVYVASVGGNLPRLGRVEAVRRQAGGWIVVTAKGTITSDR
jgi:hypothetical protein